MRATIFLIHLSVCGIALALAASAITEPDVFVFDVRRNPEPAEVILRYALEFQVPGHLLINLAQRESGLNPVAISDRNRDGSYDYGLLGLNTRTLRVLGVRPENALDVRVNARAGVGLYADYFHHGGEKFALCAYAKGPGRCHVVQLR